MTRPSLDSFGKAQILRTDCTIQPIFPLFLLSFTPYKCTSEDGGERAHSRHAEENKNLLLNSLHLFDTGDESTKSLCTRITVMRTLHFHFWHWTFDSSSLNYSRDKWTRYIWCNGYLDITTFCNCCTQHNKLIFATLRTLSLSRTFFCVESKKGFEEEATAAVAWSRLW